MQGTSSIIRACAGVYAEWSYVTTYTSVKNEVGMRPCQKLYIETRRRIESMQQSSATPKNRGLINFRV